MGFSLGTAEIILRDGGNFILKVMARRLRDQGGATMGGADGKNFEFRPSRKAKTDSFFM